MTVNPIPAGYHTVTPYLIVDDVNKLMAFLEEAWGAKGPACAQDAEGNVLHAEIKVGDSYVMMGKASADSAKAYQSTLYLYVNDIDEWYRKALSAGASAIQAPCNQYYGDRNAVIKDPCGNYWWIASRVETVAPEELARRAEAYMKAGS